MANFSSISIIDSINREVFINPLKLFPVDYEEGVVPSYCRMSFFTDDDVREIKNGILVNGEPWKSIQGETMSSMKVPIQRIISSLYMQGN